ncbi:MAG: beta-galactosidase [Colwellia sp.]
MKISRRDLCRLGCYATTAGLASATGLLHAKQNTLTKSDKSLKKTAQYKLKKLYHGVCVYPELWPREDLDRDITEMKKLGINVVRIGEFSWSTTEPEQGNISVELLKWAMDKFYQAGIDVVLCTPTATPPIWLTYNKPEHCHKDADGNIMSHGARQHASYAHPTVRAACYNIIDAMAKALGNHPALIGWQLDNELKAHVAEDFSDAAIAQWHAWLKNRFGTIKRLNKAWGTHMWSQYYQRFEQVPAPVKTPFLHSASLSTAYRLFSRENIVDFMKGQREVIRRYSTAPITHNDNPAFNINHEKSMEALDFAAFDGYPNHTQWGAFVFRSDLYRSAIPGRPFWLMETSVSHNGWLGNHQPPHPTGFLAAEAVLIYALGGEGFSYWLWRQQKTGAELGHSAVMSSWFKPSVGYAEVQKVNENRKLLEPLLINTKVAKAQVAITYSDHARAMIETENLDKRAGFPKRYRGVVEMWQAKLRDLGYHRDVRFEHAELDDLKLLITPAMPYVSSEFIERAYKFVQAGGTWLAGPVTGIRGKEHTVPTSAGLGLLDNFAGVNTEFVVPVTKTETTGEALGLTAPLSGWCAAMQATPNSQVVGRITSGVAQGRAFLTERKLGKGKVVVLGAHPHGEEGEIMINKIINHYAKGAGVTERYDVTEGTVVCPRVDDNGQQFWLAINMDAKGGSFAIPTGATDAITGNKITEKRLTLSRYQWRAINLNTSV